MKNENSLAASVKARLQNRAKESNRPFNDLLQLYGIERFLYRLSRSSYANQFVLKGALMLLTLDIPSFRPTRDIDLLGHTSNDVVHIAQIFREICDVEVEPDGISFDPNS
ncbi:MAG: nucleotidyl transferase AbiEii/AbiGii toxin family protein, partial [Chloroflexi bacterium]|nr:nucleotidyl transferase AbiEii/AbiGii toxin family protein [Chloroflexota bacterium]